MDMVDIWTQGKRLYMVTERGGSVISTTIPRLTPREDLAAMHSFFANRTWSLPALPQRGLRYHQVSHPGSWRPPSKFPIITQVTLHGELTAFDEEDVGGVVFVETREPSMDLDQAQNNENTTSLRLLPSPLSTSFPESYNGHTNRGVTELPLHPHSRCHLLVSNSQNGLLATLGTVAEQHAPSQTISLNLRAYPLDEAGRPLYDGHPVVIRAKTDIPWESRLGKIRTTNEPCTVTGTFLASSKTTTRSSGFRHRYESRIWMLQISS